MIDIVGLGPGDLSRIAEPTLRFILDPARTVVARTQHHPAAEQLAAQRSVVFCDDLYEDSDDFDVTYTAIADRVLELATAGDVIYAVPGSPRIGEFAVKKITDAVEAVVHPAESFLDLVFDRVGVDPLADGFQLLNGHDLPAVLTFDRPTVIGHLDDPAVLADVASLIDRTAPDDLRVTVLVGAGASDERIWSGRPIHTDPELAGFRTSLYVPPHDNGLIGAVSMMRRLRDECPWDQKQTHESLIRYLIEETFELAEALGHLIDGAEEDLGAYADVEEELGDVLLQVLFHSVIAEDDGAFTISDVAHQLRTKMVRRHPHVFGDVDADDAETVKQNWDQIKADEKGSGRESLLDGVPAMPGLARSTELSRRAAKVGFDWDAVDEVRKMIDTELAEFDEANDAASRRHELGDVLFTIANLARHLDIDPEVAVQSAAGRFESRFRVMESQADLSDLSLKEMNRLWEAAKAE